MTEVGQRGVLAQVAGAPENARPADGRRLPRGWRAARVGPAGQELELRWADGPAGPARLRVAVAMDIRAEALVDVLAPGSAEPMATFDIRYAYAFQVFEVELDAEQVAVALADGVRLRSRADAPELWIFTVSERGEAGSFFVPQLRPADAVGRKQDQFLDRMTSLASLQPFGWLEGCVLDGVDSLRPIVGDARADEAIAAHLDQYLDPDGQLVYEDLHGQPADGGFTTIEATLPAAVIARRDPEHPIIDKVVDYLVGHGRVIQNGTTMTAEGCYTAAYPLAVIGRRLGRPELARAAVDQLLLRRDALADGRVLTPRTAPCRWGGMYRNWARGYAWYMLGLVKVAAELRGADVAQLDEVEAEFVRIAEVALSWRLPGGLWSCYVDDPATGVETSGSSGIAAALALGANAGLLPAAAADAAESSVSALEAYLSPDGILGGVSQHNAGGERLQREGYRVYSQMGMGLMAQVYGALAARR